MLRNQTCRFRFSHSNLILSSFVAGTGWQVARGLLCKKAGGHYLLCVCASLHSSIDWYHLHTTSSIVHLCSISPPLTVEYQIWAWTIYEVTMGLSRWLGLMRPFSVAARLWWLTTMASHVVSAPMLLTPGHTRLSYTLPGHNSACKKAFRGHALYDISTSCQFDVIGW